MHVLLKEVKELQDKYNKEIAKIREKQKMEAKQLIANYKKSHPGGCYDYKSITQ